MVDIAWLLHATGRKSFFSNNWRGWQARRLGCLSS
jgi:hypothetical protein